jgi:hypothetical protein
MKFQDRNANATRNIITYGMTSEKCGTALSEAWICPIGGLGMVSWIFTGALRNATLEPSRVWGYVLNIYVPTF